MNTKVQPEVTFERWILNASRSKLEKAVAHLRAVKFKAGEEGKAEVLIEKMESELFGRAVTTILRA